MQFKNKIKILKEKRFYPVFCTPDKKFLVLVRATRSLTLLSTLAWALVTDGICYPCLSVLSFLILYMVLKMGPVLYLCCSS